MGHGISYRELCEWWDDRDLATLEELIELAADRARVPSGMEIEYH